jgi:ABC-type Na+ efflux pump permease subunit
LRIVRFTRRPSFLAVWIVVVWIVVGVVVAAIYDYFDSLETVGQVLTTIAAVLLWPLLLFGFDIQISR